MAVKIVTDSAADLPESVALEYGIEVVPIRINFGKESFWDGIDIGPEEFFRRTLQELPTTSQPPPYLFESCINPLLEQGDEVLCLTLSSALSGTYHSALIGAGKNPCKVRVVDTKLVSAGQGLLAVRAARLARKGIGLDELKGFVEQERKKIRVFATMESIDPLVKGGRINVFSQSAAERSGLSLIFTLNSEGGVQILERVRGRRLSLDRMVGFLADALIPNAAITHVDSPGETSLLAEQVEVKCQAKVVYTAAAGSSVGTYTGRGAVILAG